MPAQKTCSNCKKPAVVEYSPFCSKRCADVDLNRWLSDSYRIPDHPANDDDLPPNDYDDKNY